MIFSKLLYKISHLIKVGITNRIPITRPTVTGQINTMLNELFKDAYGENYVPLTDKVKLRNAYFRIYDILTRFMFSALISYPKRPLKKSKQILLSVLQGDTTLQHIISLQGAGPETPLAIVNRMEIGNIWSRLLAKLIDEIQETTETDDDVVNGFEQDYGREWMENQIAIIIQTKIPEQVNSFLQNRNQLNLPIRTFTDQLWDYLLTELKKALNAYQAKLPKEKIVPEDVTQPPE